QLLQPTVTRDAGAGVRGLAQYGQLRVPLEALQRLDRLRVVGAVVDDDDLHRGQRLGLDRVDAIVEENAVPEAGNDYPDRAIRSGIAGEAQGHGRRAAVPAEIALAAAEQLLAPATACRARSEQSLVQLMVATVRVLDAGVDHLDATRWDLVAGDDLLQVLTGDREGIDEIAVAPGRIANVADLVRLFSVHLDNNGRRPGETGHVRQQVERQTRVHD